MDWPNAAQAADLPVAYSRTGAGRSRLSSVCADFFLDDAQRLTDEERALMGEMLRGLVEEIGDDLLTRLPALLAAKGEAAREGVYRTLRRSGLINRASIVALLLRRADEQRLSRRSPRGGDELLSRLVGDADGNVAEAAMALTIARGRRCDRFGRIGIEFDDLQAEDAALLVQSVAACLALGIDDNHDQALAESARKIVADHDEGRRLEAAVGAVARALDGSGQLSDEIIGRIAEAGDAALLAACLSRRAGIDANDGWALFAGGEPMLLVRMSGCDRSIAATIIASFDALLGSGSPDKAIDRFDRLDQAAADDARRWLRLDPDYRAARAALEDDNG